MSNESTGVTREGWRLLFATLKLQRRALIMGACVGLAWTLGKVAVPQLTKLAIDRGIEKRLAVVLDSIDLGRCSDRWILCCVASFHRFPRKSINRDNVA